MTLRWEWLVWVLTRTAPLLLLPLADAAALGDLHHYLSGLQARPDTGWHDTLAEYPLPAVLALAAPYAVLNLAGLGGLTPVVWVGSMLAADLVLMRRVVATGSRDAAVLWLVAIPALGPVAYCRFDLLAGVLIALGVAAAGTRPGRAGVLAAVATGLKYSPALVLPALLAAARPRRGAVVAVAATGAVLVAVTAALGGVDRLLTPLRYQSDRGLQVESVGASATMLERIVSPERFRVFYAHSLSWEVAGPGVGSALVVSVVATAVLLAVLAWLWTRAWAAETVTTESLVWLSLAGLIAFIVSGKVLSPQYLLWLLPVAVLGVGLLGADRAAPLRRWTWLLVAACVLTHGVWPYGYTALVHDSAGAGAVAAALVVRNLLLVGLAVAALRHSFRVTARATSDA